MTSSPARSAAFVRAISPFTLINPPLRGLEFNLAIPALAYNGSLAGVGRCPFTHPDILHVLPGVNNTIKTLLWVSFMSIRLLAALALQER